MKVINPHNSKTVGNVNLSSLSEAEHKVALAKSAIYPMKQLSTREKSSILQEIIKGIQAHFDALVNTIILESGKPYRYAKGEVKRAIQTFTTASEECKRLPHQLIDLSPSEMGEHLKGEIVYFPKGIIFGISPFNFPLNLAAHKIAPAIAAGCPIILKPSGKTPLTMELLAKIIKASRLPKNAFQLLHCSRETGNHLVTHPDIQVLSFTGSPAVGWEMKSKAGKKQVILELGGNAAAIVHQDAHLELAIQELIIGGFAYSGQVCIHTQRIYVHHSLFNIFLNEYIQETNALKIGNPLDEATEIGVMIDEHNAIRVENWVNEAIASGAQCLSGGKREGSLYYPTILTNVKKGQKVRDEEVFGPVVIIESYEKIEDAIREVNDTRWGLQSSIFTDSIATRNKVFNELEVGAVIHNKSTTFRVDEMIYGGIKDSGFGREGVQFTIKDYLEPKLLVRN